MLFPSWTTTAARSLAAPEGGLVRVDPQGRVQKPPFFQSGEKLDSPAVYLDGVLYVGSEPGLSVRHRNGRRAGA